MNKLSNLNLSKVPGISKKEKTIFELSGFPHYENVISNYLRFYANPNENHGFDDLFIKIFIKAYGQKLENNLYFENVGVQREVITEKGRIDLLIITDSFVIAIENKIFHHAQSNPFGDYKKYLEDNYSSLNHICLVLSLKKEIINHSGFKNLTYKFFFSQIKEWLKDNYFKVNNLRGLFFLDIMKSIENLMNNKELPSSVLTYLKNNKDEITKLNEATALFYDVLKMKLVKLNSIIEKSAKVNMFYKSKTIWNQDWIKQKLESLLLLNLNDKVVGNSEVNVKIRISPEGWSIEFWDLKRISNEIKEILESNSKEGCIQETSDKKSKFIIFHRFPFDEDENIVFEVLYQIINKLEKKIR
jgi:hypothetical protein